MSGNFLPELLVLNTVGRYHKIFDIFFWYFLGEYREEHWFLKCFGLCYNRTSWKIYKFLKRYSNYTFLEEQRERFNRRTILSKWLKKVYEFCLCSRFYCRDFKRLAQKSMNPSRTIIEDIILMKKNVVKYENVIISYHVSFIFLVLLCWTLSIFRKNGGISDIQSPN